MKTARLLCIPFALASVPALAWGPKGHTVIAAIAWQRLSSATRMEVARILLAGDTVRSQAGVTSYVPRSPGGPMHAVYLESSVQPMFIRSANWADEIKGGKSDRFDQSIDWLNDHSDLALVSPKEKVRCKSWHYLDLPITKPGDEHPHPFAGSNADYAINLAMAGLKEEEQKQHPNRRKQALWLYFLIHVVGDLHQPLHCSSSYMVKSKGDDGGNGFHIDSFMTLHKFWDSGVDHATAMQPELKNKSASFVAQHWLAEPAFKPGAEAADLEPMSWIQKGHDLAVSDAYTIPENTKPDNAYVTNQATVCKRQAILGGYRLAALLNKVLKRP